MSTPRKIQYIREKDLATYLQPLEVEKKEKPKVQVKQKGILKVKKKKKSKSVKK